MNLLNDFNIKLIEKETKAKMVNCETKTAPYSVSVVINLEFEYKKTKLYKSIEVYEDEEEKVKKIIKIIKSYIKEYDKIKMQKWERSKFTFNVITAIETRGKMEQGSKEYYRLYNLIGGASFRTYMREYMDRYVKENNKAVYIEVYNHCVENLIDDTCKSSL